MSLDDLELGITGVGDPAVMFNVVIVIFVIIIIVIIGMALYNLMR